MKSKQAERIRASDVLPLLQGIARFRQEHFICLSLDSSGRVIKRHTVFIGTLTSIIIHPREIFAAAIADRAAEVIVAHNHPSGEATPSDQDVETTQQLVAAGLILGIPVKDHVIVAQEEHYSFKQHMLI